MAGVGVGSSGGQSRGPQSPSSAPESTDHDDRKASNRGEWPAGGCSTSAMARSAPSAGFAVRPISISPRLSALLRTLTFVGAIPPTFTLRR